MAGESQIRPASQCHTWTSSCHGSRGSQTINTLLRYSACDFVLSVEIEREREREWFSFQQTHSGPRAVFCSVPLLRKGAVEGAGGQEVRWEAPLLSFLGLPPALLGSLCRVPVLPFAECGPEGGPFQLRGLVAGLLALSWPCTLGKKWPGGVSPLFSSTPQSHPGRDEEPLTHPERNPPFSDFSLQTSGGLEEGPRERS